MGGGRAHMQRPTLLHVSWGGAVSPRGRARRRERRWAGGSRVSVWRGGGGGLCRLGSCKLGRVESPWRPSLGKGKEEEAEGWWCPSTGKGEVEGAQVGAGLCLVWWYAPAVQSSSLQNKALQHKLHGRELQGREPG